KVSTSSTNISTLNLAGLHNRRNAWLASLVASKLLPDVDIAIIHDILNKFPGTSRRFEQLSENIYSDYAHHPIEIAATPSLKPALEFKSAPIVSINLWYSEPVTDVEFTGLLDSRIEWVFNKNAISGSSQSGHQHLALVISSAHETARLNKEELIALAIGEMNRFFPAARNQKPVHAFVVREHDATLSHTVGTARLRPTQQTEFENFFLAGDWTDTDLPATIESAVFSGHECAKLLLKK
ncbi:MAG: FAD-dependent oxidoreductase, partial [Acidobacteria bacterium]|nr:FAD-dependent oxidoreductase [Acidobacteriota bacterium]